MCDGPQFLHSLCTPASLLDAGEAFTGADSDVEFAATYGKIRDILCCTHRGRQRRSLEREICFLFELESSHVGRAAPSDWQMLKAQIASIDLVVVTPQHTLSTSIVSGQVSHKHADEHTSVYPRTSSPSPPPLARAAPVLPSPPPPHVSAWLQKSLCPIFLDGRGHGCTTRSTPLRA